MSQILDVVTLPLDRPRQLVEASAGTGKTFTLAQLVLRFVVEENVPVEALLVVTFTEAATLELRERIRHRMREALDPEKYDAVLKRLWDRWCDTPGEALARQRLRTALASLELATISTIHGWCQRVIQEFGSELGMVEGAEVVTDVQPLQEQVWHDLARHCTLGEPRTVAAQMAGLNDPHKWMSLASRGPTLLPGLDPSVPTAEDVARLVHAESQSREALARVCEHYAMGMLATISGHVDAGRLNKQSYSEKKWVGDVAGDRLAELHIAIEGGKEETWIAHLASAESWQKKLKKGFKDTPHPCMLFGDAYLAWCEAKTTLKAATDARALHRWHDLLARVPAAYRQAKGPQRMDFDDLLIGVEQAVKQAYGTDVLPSLRRRWQIALVDEFQDTDAVQWGIFSQVFPADTHDARMILVGDPKQSIYAFRGAELDVYFGARDAVPPHCRWNLGTNFRSDGRVLEAIEHWFTEEGRQPFLDERMQWQAVRAHHPASRLMVERVPVAPMRFVRPEAPDEESGLDNHEILVRDIVWSLSNPSETWVVTSEGRRRLTAADIAVLVPSHTKAAKVQAALIHAGVPAVRRTRASVWESEAAGDLRVLLRAVLEPGRRRHVAALLHSRLMPLDAAGVACTLEDEARYAEVLLKLHGWREVLERRGVLGLIHEAMSEVVVTSLGHEDGARWVTDVRHVGELLHAMARRKGSSTLALPSVLAELGREDAEAEAPRLERDGDAVRVMTYHASKGLEFGVVYLPELRSAPAKNPPFSWSRAGTRTLVVPDIKFEDAGADDLADVRAQEQERLLYVAMTRAVYGIVVPHPPHLGRNSGASMAVMRLGKFTGKTGEWPGLQTFLDTSNGLAVLDTSPRPLTRLTREQHTDGFRAPVRAERVPPPPSRRTSFSRITSSHAGDDLPDHDAAMPRLEPMNLEDAAPQTDSFMSFPRGAKPGTAVHEVFEEIDFQKLQGPEADGVIAKALKNYGFDEDRWLEPVRQMLTDTCETPLGPHGVQLASLTRGKRLDEFSFAMPVENVEAALYALGDALACDARFADYAKAVRVLPPQQVEGLLTGFIDLVFEAGGRFYVVDYKTNFLGNHPEAYVAHRLDQAMAEHHYTLQGLIYSVAMSRFFEQRVPDWSEDRWGGIVYLFVRGMRGRNAEDGVWFWRPSLEQLTIAAQGFGGGE